MSRKALFFSGAVCAALFFLGCESDRLSIAPASPAITGNWGADSLRYYISFSDAATPGDSKNYVMFELSSVYDTTLRHSAERGTWSVSKSVNGGGTWSTTLADELVLIPVSCTDSLGAPLTCPSPYTMTISFTNFGNDLMLSSGRQQKTLQRVW